jgi:nitrite reductase/ring-hydroxylating ferredoxin subunit
MCWKMNVTDQAEWVKIAELSQLGDGEMIGAEICDRYVAAYKIDGALYATSGLCTHAFALLSDGFLENHVVECPLHGYCFDVRTGKSIGSARAPDLEVYPVRAHGGDVEVQIKRSSAESLGSTAGVPRSG